jgi:hypothetical protein
MTILCKGCGLPIHNTETCAQARRKNAAKLDVGFPLMEPVGEITVLEKKSPEPLQVSENVANVANQEVYGRPSFRKYKDPDKRRKYMRDLMRAKRDAKGVKTRKRAP